jgi:hypothetical protein
MCSYYTLLAPALTSSTLLVKCLFVTCKVSVITVCFSNKCSSTPYCCNPHEQPGSSGQTSLVTAAYQRICFTRLFTTRFHTGQPDLRTFFHSSECAGNSHALWLLVHKLLGGKLACTLVAGTQVSGRETCVHTGCWHTGDSLRGI